MPATITEDDAEKMIELALKGNDVIPEVEDFRAQPEEHVLIPESKKEEPVTQEPPAEPATKEQAKGSDVEDFDAPPPGTVATAPVINNKNLRSTLERTLSEKRDLEKKLQDESDARLKEAEDLRKQIEEIQSERDRLATERPLPPKKLSAEEINAIPAVKAKREQILDDVDSIATLLGPRDGKILTDKFAGLLSEFTVMKQLPPGEQQDAALEALHSRVENELGEGNKREVFSLLGRSLPAYRAYMEEIRKIEADSESHYANEELSKYSATEKEFRDLLNPLGSLPEEVIEAQPYAVESYVAKLVSSDPAWERRSTAAKREIAEVLAGLKPLSPEDRKKLASNDIGGLSEVDKKRLTTFKQKQGAAAKRLYSAMMLLPVLPQLLEELEVLRGSADASENERQAIDGVKPVKEERPAPKQAIPEDPDKLVDLAFSGAHMPEFSM